MALSRREFQLLTERVAKLEATCRRLEDQLKIFDNRMKPDNLLRTVRQQEDLEKRKSEN